MTAIAPPDAEVAAGHRLGLLREMMRIRLFEEKCIALYQKEKIRGFLHVYVGEEAIAVGVMQAVRPQDAIVATYREHGQALARGIAMGPIMAEMFGKQEGCSHGRGGSMHIFDRATNFFGGNAIVGGGLPLATGLALAFKLRSEKQVAVCFFGEGAVAEGEFHESLNLAALWQLPVLFVCENNLYAMGTALCLSESETDMHAKAQAYRIPSQVVDGMDVLAVEQAATGAMAAILGGSGPQFLECRTYRFRAHSMFDAELYRNRSEVEEWKRRDPLRLMEKKMRDQNALDDARLAELKAAVAAEVEAAVVFAEAGTWEPVADLARHVYADPSQ